jgi:hypothetical protein
MKATYIVYFCISVATGVAQSPASSTNAVTITGFSVGGERTRYTVPASELPCSVTWNAETDPFPQELSNFVTRASSFLGQSHQLGGTHRATTFGIDDILIKGIEFTSHTMEMIGKDESGFTNQWFVAITFYGADPVDLGAANPFARKHIVMLLDGTCAKEEKEQSPRPKWSITNGSPAQSISNISNQVSAHSLARDPDPYGKRSHPNFPICEVQWDPFTQPFPLDLRVQATRAKEYLLSVPDLPQGLTLNEIALWRYVPVEALKAANKPTSQHRHHWEVVFWFRNDRRRGYDVHMLLDTTILPRTTASPPRSTSYPSNPK